MKVYHVEFAKTGTSLSGGEKNMLEIITYLKSRGIKNVLLTTDNGKRTYESLGLHEDNHLSYITIESYKTEKYHIFISYLLRLLLIKKILKNIINSMDRKEDILMCHSDFFPNTIPTAILSRYFSKVAFWWFHMIAPGILRGFEGQYTGRFTFPSITNLHYRLNQVLFFILARKGLVISVNPYYRSFLTRKRVRFYILQKFGGVEHVDMSVDASKEYDLVFLGRFHKQKGINEIPDILERVKRDIPNVRLVMIGGGSEEIKSSLQSELRKRHIENNVVLLGPVIGEDRFKVLSKSKVFVFPSYYESYGIVALEAMSLGLPVVAYNLPPFEVFTTGMIKVPILDNDAFAKEIVRLLSDDTYRLVVQNEARAFAGTFAWKKTGEEIYQLIIKQ